ncbi:MAG: HAD hydrolase-like protein [Flavobacteriaceae bacterium]|nr:HAD hydrolase-like protein [Flavobacteriaceae bacterium]
MNIVFDLDGTLSCCKKRIYNLFDYLVKDSEISYESYWTLKFANLTNQEILKRYFRYSQQQTDTFTKEWMNLIESPLFIAYDSLFDDVEGFLKSITKKANLYVCTARQSKNGTLEQLGSFGILPFFKGVLVTEQKKTKTELIVENIKDISSIDWIIGDTGHDIETGKKLGINTCAVLSGIMNQYNIEHYKPTKVVNKVTNFKL